jgi:hypothetical protein
MATYGHVNELIESAPIATLNMGGRYELKRRAKKKSNYRHINHG